MQKYIISVDWFQIACKRNPSQSISEGMYFTGTDSKPEGKPNIYKLTQGREYNAIFGNCLSVELHDFRLATIYCEPRPSSMKKSLCLIKVANPLLYSPRWMWYLCDIMAALGWEYQSISRIDVCCDFNTFYGGLDPREFIRRYLRSGVYSDICPSYYRVGGNKYEVIGRKKIFSEFDGGFESTSAKHVAEYLRFGQRKSGVAVYLYNKSLELDEQKSKRYIRKLWIDGGLLDDEQNPVFRLEFSISPAIMNVKCQRTEEERQQLAIARSVKSNTIDRWRVRSLALDDFGTQAAVENVFWGFATKYFRFKLVGRQATPFHWKDVVLFETNFSSQLKPYRCSFPMDGGVAERNAANRLEQILTECQSLSITESASIETSIAVLRKLSQEKQSIYQPEQLERVTEGLRKGWSWEELRKRRIVPTTVLAKLRDVVENAATRELAMYKNDPHVLEAMTEHDAILQSIENEAEAWSQIIK